MYHVLRPEEKDWEPQNHDVTTTSAKTKMKKFQKSIPTEDARPGRNDRLGQDLNPGTYGLTAPAALFGTVLYNTQQDISNTEIISH